jgi:hypothetical protein
MRDLVAEAPPHLQMVIARADLIIVSVHDACRELGEGLARGGPRRPWHLPHERHPVSGASHASRHCERTDQRSPP